VPLLEPPPVALEPPPTPLPPEPPPTLLPPEPPPTPLPPPVDPNGAHMFARQSSFGAQSELLAHGGAHWQPLHTRASTRRDRSATRRR
jgi:hypothetical protein